MGIIKEYVCLAHGRFEAMEAVCPKGCTATVERRFFTAPSIKSDNTKTSDSAMERLASRFGMTDMSTRNGSVGGSRNMPKDTGAQWLELPKSDKESKNDVITPALGNLGVHTGRIGDEPTFEDIRSSLNPLKPIVAGSSGSQNDLAEAVSKI